MRDVHGWKLPDEDRYFDQFVTGPAEWDGFQTDHLRKALGFVQEWRVALDIGAHCGFWTVPMASRFEKVYAFEASKATFDAMAANTARLSNVTRMQVAIGEARKMCSIDRDPKRMGNTGSHFIRTGDDVQMIPIDELELQNVDFMKIDVEGYEPFVIEGARKTINRCRPVIIMETDKKFSLDRFGMPNEAAENALLQMGYRKAAHVRPDTIFVP